jgi:hypothetical protein
MSIGRPNTTRVSNLSGRSPRQLPIGPCSQRVVDSGEGQPKCDERSRLRSSASSKKPSAVGLPSRRCRIRPHSWAVTAESLPALAALRPSSRSGAAYQTRRLCVRVDHGLPSGLWSIHESRKRRSSWRKRSGSARESIATILPLLTVKTVSENGVPCGDTTTPATPLTSSGYTNGDNRA